MRAFIAEGDNVTVTFDIHRVERAIQEKQTFWLDLGVETPEKTKLLLEQLSVHPLIIEDIWLERSLPKIEEFDDYLYVLVHGVRRGSKPSEIDLIELDILLGSHWVITHHQESHCVAAVQEELARSARLLKKGPSWVVHALLDHLVDDYMPLLDQLDEELVKLEEDVLTKVRADKSLMSRLLTFKRGVMKLRRISSYQRDILVRLSRNEFDKIPEEAVPFFRDVFDHFARVNDSTDGHRELISGTMEAYLSVQSNRMNEVMKRLTLMSTIMMPLTFIAGVYGMNFKIMPELEWRWGYPFVIVLMVVVAIFIVTFFRRMRWL